MRPVHREHHAAQRVGWLRAAVLGANDGIVSTASLIVGVASAGTGRGAILIAGLAGLAAGAMSMAAGEYVSVSSQADAERADLARERQELREEPADELNELTAIYVGRGLTPELAREVAVQFTERDALAAHARDELGITEIMRARPLQAAFASATSFTAGAAIPLVMAAVAVEGTLAWSVSAAATTALVVLGVLGARAGNARPWRAAIRVTFWGVAAMAVTAMVGRLFSGLGA
jgi:VIT1/CCC1 family predicted Fe2+/Mn2+ transporter